MNRGILAGMRSCRVVGLSALLAGLVACGTSSSTSASDLNDEYGLAETFDTGAPNCLDLTVIPDPALRAAIRRATSTVEGQPLTLAQLGSVGELASADSGISSLEGIYCLSAMTSTHVAGNLISDLSPLSRVLSGVSQLDVSRNSVDLASLAGLRLRWLWLNECGLTDLQALPALETLDRLYLANNQLSSIASLYRATNLAELDLSANQLVSLSGIEPLVGLTTLVLENNQVVDVSPLGGLSKLLTLRLAGNLIADPSPLAALTGLESLDLDRNPLSDSATVGELDRLVSLSVVGAGLTTVAFVSRLSRLETLSAADNLISDLRPLRSLPRLRTANLSNNAVSDLTPLAENLDLGIGNVVDVTRNPIDCVAQAPNLESLRLRGVDVLHDCVAALSPSATAAPP